VNNKHTLLGSIFDEVKEMTTGPRAAQHGDYEQNMNNTVGLIEAYINACIIRQQGPDARHVWLAPQDVPIIMALVKIGRMKSGEYNPDDYKDLVGYAGIAGALSALRESPSPSIIMSATETQAVDAKQSAVNELRAEMMKGMSMLAQEIATLQRRKPAKRVPPRKKR